MRLRHPQQLLVHAPIATYYQYPRAIPVSAAPELQLYILLHFRRRGERGDGITNLTVDRHALLHENAGGAQTRGQRDRYLGHSRKCTDGGGKEPAATDTGKDGDLVEGSSKETTNEPMNANSQEEEVTVRG